MSAVCYVLDAEDRLTWLDPSWDATAIAGGAPRLLASFVLGTRLWPYLADAPTIDLYHVMLERVRRGHAFDVPFTGDGPTVARNMRLRLRPLPGGSVECRSLVDQEGPAGTLPHRQAPAPRVADPLVACGWCHRIKVSEDWQDPEDAVTTLRVFMRPQVPAVTHGVCPTCRERLINEAR